MSKNHPLSLSLLDRLIDENPARSEDDEMDEVGIRRRVREGLQRDITSLLSTRSWLGTWPREYTHLKTSLLNYGLPDVTGVAIGSEDVQRVLRTTVQMAIRIFEPRLAEVHVYVATEPQSRSAHLMIKAQVRDDHEPLVLSGGLGQSTLTDLSKAGQ